MANSKIPQHKEMAMGKKVTSYAKGGPVKGLPESPLTIAKRNNGVDGMKKGGMKKGGKC